MNTNKETETIRIVTYEPQYQEAFKSLNTEWISKYFEIEAADTIALDHPKEYILDKGGEIFIALLNDEPVGVCAMIKMQEDFDYEMAKMAVSPKAQGKGIGLLLGRFVIDWAAKNKATTI
ncbi:MAG: MarR family transcriptional regulator, partial [Flavobacterium johnsoniae]